MERNYYIPQFFKVKRVIQESEDVKTFFIKRKFDFLPGQFLEISFLGAGEVPISISSSPKEDYIQFTLRRVGEVTAKLFETKQRDSIGIRGPFGNGFNIKELEGKDLIFIAGGLGIAPLRGLLRLCLRNRNKFANIYLLYGARSPQDMLYKQELRSLLKSKDMVTHLIVDKEDKTWEGDVGVVTDLLNKINIKPRGTTALVCGPSIMMRFCVDKLLKKDINKKNIILSLERHMKCGIGKCGHCYIGQYFVCKDGPVFKLSQLDNLRPEQVIY